MSDHERVTVTSPAGKITGLSDGEIRRFHSVPYSVIPGPFTDAERIPREQRALIDATVHHPRDTALSVVTPAGAKTLDDLPVVVYIHGGRFEHGTHGDRRADGAPNARDGIITVHLGYRVKLEGFARFPDDEPGHFRGIHDCQLGLEWVQRNIESFGGDPTNITLVGQSAGATVALWLARRDHYRGAFRRMLAMSPCFPRESFEQRKGSLRLALGKPVTRASLTRLAEEKPELLHRAYDRFRTIQGLDMALGPTDFDGTELADIPILLTSTRDEHYDMPIGRKIDARGLGPTMVRLLARRMGVRGSVAEYLREAQDLDPARPMGRLIGDAANRRWVAQAAEQAPGPVWLAEFVADSRPAVHCEEIPLLFGVEEGEKTAAIRSMFVDFVRGNTPEWRSYAASTGRWCRILNTATSDVSSESDTLRMVREAFGPH
ncbi:carboxylesterase family protein [Corynebacterium sp. YIM 101645]|uniref:Carboxylic ester hydrolase n=1 Tax=Corynebacterium lemuris TaxID=1859292 RepID=A0ABT2FY31_9CORY|nr:carboxylesterase family protein [Corynebacterium lemuris]MCS5480143.1 carboxylesterase family protein [Corynebacterium lemuris]